jgi:hypothetical protein
MVVIMDVFLQDIYKLADDFSDIGIIDTNYLYPKLEKVNTSNKKINNTVYNTLLLIEPHTAYIIDTKQKPDNDILKVDPKLNKVGLLINTFIDTTHKMLIYNITLNTIYLNKNIYIGELINNR